jgi:hypothetical protein
MVQMDCNNACHCGNLSAACAHDPLAQQSSRYAITYLHNDRRYRSSRIGDEVSHKRKHEGDISSHDRVSLKMRDAQDSFAKVIAGSLPLKLSLLEV